MPPVGHTRRVTGTKKVQDMIDSVSVLSVTVEISRRTGARRYRGEGASGGCSSSGSARSRSCFSSSRSGSDPASPAPPSSAAPRTCSHCGARSGRETRRRPRAGRDLYARIVASPCSAARDAALRAARGAPAARRRPWRPWRSPRGAAPPRARLPPALPPRRRAAPLAPRAPPLCIPRSSLPLHISAEYVVRLKMHLSIFIVHCILTPFGYYRFNFIHILVSVETAFIGVW